MDYALGHRHSVDDLPPMQNDYYDTCGCVYSLWTNQSGKVGKIEGIESVLKNEGIYWDSLIEEGDYVREHMLMGEFLFDASSAEDMCSKIKMINDLVSVKNEDGNEMVIHYTDYNHLLTTSRNYAERV